MLRVLVDIYTAVHYMSSMLNIDFYFPKPGSRQKTSNLPEIRLLALLVISVKLYYPFDSLERHPRSHLDKAVLTVDWNKWCELHEQHDRRVTSKGEIGRGNEFLVTEQDIMKMSGAQLDEYLDWYEKTWIDEEDDKEKKGRLPQQLLDMFPTGRTNGSTAATVDFGAETKAEQQILDDKLRKIQSRLKPRAVITAEREETTKGPVRRPGSFYKRYRKIEDLPPQAKTFHEAAASLIGVSLSTLVIAVRQMERNLQVWRAERLKERDGESQDDESTSAEEAAEGMEVDAERD
jgi:RNA polymerase I-specific transcription initiation factor RRN7